MTKLEKRNNARDKLAKKIVDNILLISGGREIVEGPRGGELLQLMQKETHDLIFNFENKYVLEINSHE